MPGNGTLSVLFPFLLAHAQCTPDMWNRYGFIKHFDLSKVRLIIICRFNLSKNRLIRVELMYVITRCDQQLLVRTSHRIILTKMHRTSVRIPVIFHHQ